MNAVVSVDKNWGIGIQNDLLFHVPKDMRYFKRMTIGKIVVMGEKTFFSLPNQKPLKDRNNIVLSDNPKLATDSATVCNSLNELLLVLRTCKTDEIFIIGGQAIYELMLPYCSVVYVTQFCAQAKADKQFPNLSKSKEWELVEQSAPSQDERLIFTFNKYKKR